MTPRLLIRADGGARVGAGHVLRCLALADAWSRNGGDPVFLTGEGAPALARMIQARGYALDTVSVPDLASDAAATLSRAAAVDALCVVVDGYQFDEAYHRRVRAGGLPLMAIDDTVRLAYYDVDVLLNPSLGAERMSYRCPPEARLLLGIDYVLLRREFWAARPEPAPPAPALASRVLVTLGGADPVNATLVVVRALGRLCVSRPDLQVKVVVGPANPHRPSLSAFAETVEAVDIVDAPDDMSSLMRWAHLAVATTGGTCWELAFMGVPMATVVIVDNQQLNAEALAGAAVSRHLGRVGELSEDQIAASVAALLGDPERRADMAARGRALVDGRGAFRAAEVLRALSSR